MQIKEIPPNNPRIVMAVEAATGVGLVVIWISLLLYHIYAHDEPPAFSASDSLAKKAILLTYPDLKPIHFSLFFSRNCSCRGHGVNWPDVVGIAPKIAMDRHLCGIRRYGVGLASVSSGEW